MKHKTFRQRPLPTPLPSKGEAVRELTSENKPAVNRKQEACVPQCTFRNHSDCGLNDSRIAEHVAVEVGFAVEAHGVGT